MLRLLFQYTVVYSALRQAYSESSLQFRIFLTDGAHKLTEQAKNHISSYIFAMIEKTNKEGSLCTQSKQPV
jgi:hypothetical protein